VNGGKLHSDALTNGRGKACGKIHRQDRWNQPLEKLIPLGVLAVNRLPYALRDLQAD
jgi:hypothetical protein